MSQLILVVEDDPMMQKMAMKILRSRGFGCELAGNGREAVSKAAALKAFTCPSPYQELWPVPP